MTPVALALVLTAAFAHATWNLLAKRIGGGAPFVWLTSVLSVAIYAPLTAAVVALQHPHIGGIQLVFLAGTAVLHTAYFLMLLRGYRAGDLSLVYPLARGTGPMLSAAGAIAILGERPGPVAILGTLLVGVGIFLLATPVASRPPARSINGVREGRSSGSSPAVASNSPADSSNGAREARPTISPHPPGSLARLGARRAIAYALATGAVIAMYTLWDKRAVSVYGIPPLLVDWGSNVGRAAVLTPHALACRAAVRGLWDTHRGAILAVAALTPLAYILVLTALVFTPVSYVAPAREISILIGTAMGARLLAEGHAGRRLLAAGAMVAGLAALALG